MIGIIQPVETLVFQLLIDVNFDVLRIRFDRKRTGKNKDSPLGVKAVSQGIKYNQRSSSEEKRHQNPKEYSF